MVGKRVGWTAVSLLWAGTAGAQQLDITVDEQAAAALGIDVAALEQQLNAEAATAFNLADPTTFMDSMANAASISSKGMGVDYASNFDTFVVGGSLGSSVHSSGFRFGRSDEALPPGGFAFMVSAMAGAVAVSAAVAPARPGSRCSRCSCSPGRRGRGTSSPRCRRGWAGSASPCW